jgi:hypothetical protein
VAAVWPPDRPVHLVADRGFPSQVLLRTLAQVGWGYTLRLRADARLVVADEATMVRALLASAQPGRWTSTPATYGGTSVQGQVVLGRGLVVLPWQQRDAASQRHRARQQAERRRVHTQRWPGRAATDAWVVLFTTLPAAAAHTVAPWVYRGRWATEGTDRDLQGGWDGRHGWDLEGVLARVSVQAQVARLLGLAALGLLVQSWLGVQARHAAAQAAVAADPVAAVVAGWTTSGRLSVWARGRFVLHDPSGRLTAWAAAVLTEGAARIAAARPTGSAPGRPAAPPARTVPAVTSFPTVTACALTA